MLAIFNPFTIVLLLFAVAQLRMLGPRGRVVEVRSGNDHYFKGEVKRWFLVPYWDTLSYWESGCSGRSYMTFEYKSAEAAELAIDVELKKKDAKKALHANDFSRTVMKVYKGG